MKDSKPPSQFVLCIRNDGADDLEPRKVYRLLPDRAADEEGLSRIVDESGEDYLYPTAYFVPVRLPAVAAREFFARPTLGSLAPVRKARRG